MMKLPISLSYETPVKDYASRYVLRNADGTEIGHIWQSKNLPEAAAEIVACVNSPNGQMVIESLKVLSKVRRLLSEVPLGERANISEARGLLRDFLDRVIVIPPKDSVPVKPS